MNRNGLRDKLELLNSVLLVQRYGVEWDSAGANAYIAAWLLMRTEGAQVHQALVTDCRLCAAHWRTLDAKHI